MVSIVVASWASRLVADKGRALAPALPLGAYGPLGEIGFIYWECLEVTCKAAAGILNGDSWLSRRWPSVTTRSLPFLWF